MELVLAQVRIHVFARDQDRIPAFVPYRDLFFVQDQVLFSVLVGILSFVQVLSLAFVPTQVRDLAFFQCPVPVFFHARVRARVVLVRDREPIRQFVFVTLGITRLWGVDQFVEFRNFLIGQDVGGTTDGDQPVQKYLYKTSIRKLNLI